MCVQLSSIENYLKSLTSRADLEVLEGLLKSADLKFTDVQSLCQFDPNHYCRNLVSSGEWFDMLLICWRPGQESSIHDHVGSSCAFKILKGVSTETVYKKIGKQRQGIDLVRPLGSMCYQPGELCLAQDEAIHKIGNQSDKDDLVTLHIYSPPLQMAYYETEDGESGGYQPPEIDCRKNTTNSLNR